MRPLRTFLLAMALGGCWVSSLNAHPHMWVTTEATVLYENGAFIGLHHKWTFDEFYAATAIEGLDKNKDGKYDREELAELAKVNVEGLKDFEYFTFPKLAGQDLKLSDAKDYWLEFVNDKLSLHFTVPFAQPVLVEAKGLAFTVQDPTFYIAFEPAKTEPVKFAAGTPKSCKVRIGEPPKTDEPPKSMPGEAASAQLGAFGIVSAKTMSVDCAGP